MITNDGKAILAKYLIGQTPSYASHIAVGCGKKPLDSADVIDLDQFNEYSNKKALEFEMFRVPIVSRGLMSETDILGNKISSIVFTAEVPTKDRYDITEIGIYPSGFNQSAGSTDSKLIYSFSQTERWENHTSTEAKSIPYIASPLDGIANDNIIIPKETVSSPELSVFQTNASNKVFTNEDRVSRYEPCRFLDDVIAIRGDESTISVAESGALSATGNHIHLTGITLDLDKNAPTDELRLAFSVINKDGRDPNNPADTVANPATVRILVEFKSTEANVSSEVAQYANFEVDIDNGDTLNGELVDFATNRYFVVKKSLESLVKSRGFTWSSVDVVKISACVLVGGQPSDDFYVCLDAMRLENLSTFTPVYGLVGYSVIKSTDAKPVTLAANTNSFIEFRFSMGLDVPIGVSS